MGRDCINANTTVSKCNECMHVHVFSVSVCVYACTCVCVNVCLLAYRCVVLRYLAVLLIDDDSYKDKAFNKVHGKPKGVLLKKAYNNCFLNLSKNTSKL